MRRIDGDARADAFFSWPEDPACKGCIHYRRLVERHQNMTGKVCHYLLDTGHARGCPFGEHCTKKETPQTSGQDQTADHSGERNTP